MSLAGMRRTARALARTRRAALQESEKGFMQAVIDLANVHGWTVYHPYSSRRSTPGFPDLTLCRPGRLIMAELKTERGRLTTAQSHWKGILESVEGVDYRLWRPADWPEIESTLTA